MAARIRMLLVWLGFAVALSGASLRHDVLAELGVCSGTVERDHAASVGRWSPARPAATFELGDGVRTGANGKAELRLRGGGALKLDASSRLRFRASANTERSVQIETGSALLEADDGDVRLRTNIGLAVLDKGGAMRLTAGSESMRIEVVVGKAHFETDTGDHALAAGSAIDVSVGGAILDETGDAGASSTPGDARQPAADAGAAAEDAFVAEVTGPGARIRARDKRTFEPLAQGSDPVFAGDVIQVPRGARVTVRSGRRRATLVGSGEYVVGGPRPVLVRAVRGRMAVETDGEDVVVEAPGGTITARAEEGRTSADVDVSPRETKVAVQSGRVELRGHGAPQLLRAGDTGALDPRGTLEANAAAAAHADFGVRAGESFVVRDPHPPSAIGFDFASTCRDGGVVVVNGAHVRGDGRAAVLLSAGTHDYVVHCVVGNGVSDANAASGHVTVVADSGLAQLPRTPPATQVDADGRRYTVLYQNQLPNVVARWPDAPASTGYVLHWDAHETKSKRSSVQVSSGLGEGSHSLWFETTDSSKRSQTTTLVLRFDNAAPTASVSEPANGSFQPGDDVRVSGVAVEGWSVSVGGKPLQLDAEKRFAGDCAVPAEDSGVAIRLAHPTRGIVYYVRHARGGSR